MVSFAGIETSFAVSPVRQAGPFSVFSVACQVNWSFSVSRVRRVSQARQDGSRNVVDNTGYMWKRRGRRELVIMHFGGVFTV